MKTTNIYREIIDTRIDCYEHKCFFAFSNEQLKEGKEKAGITDEKIYSAGSGLYGTHEGITSYFKAVDDNTNRVTKECDPQDVYNYEYDNHECGFVHEDTEAIKLVVAYFGEEKAKIVKRRNAYIKIDDLFKK